MAINNRTVAQVQAGLSATNTTENAFQTDTDNMIAQVDRSVNQINIVGAVQGNATLADGTADNALTVEVTAAAVGSTYPNPNFDPNRPEGPGNERTITVGGIPATSIRDGDLVPLTVNGVTIGNLLINV